MFIDGTYSCVTTIRVYACNSVIADEVYWNTPTLTFQEMELIVKSFNKKSHKFKF